MKSVTQIADEIVAREGGYVNDPDDPGGPTNYGVTLATARRLGLDLDRDGDVDVDDMRKITREDARRIFLTTYFRAPRIGLLPDEVQASVFDMYVNAGSNAVRILQRLLRRMGQDIAVDGVIGPLTAKAAFAALQAAPDQFVDAYGIERRNYYYRIADKRPQSRKFARSANGGKGGWIRRAEEFISERYHLSEAEHRQRVSSWG